MPANEVLLSICMIVKDEEKNLSLTLPPLAAGADELIVVDTGSSDDSARLAANLGARVYQYQWGNDFSAARNFSLSQATGKWIFWMDADEYVKLEDLKSLRALLASSDETAYQVSVRECAFGSFESHLYYWRVKIFRNFYGIHFVRPINEQVFNKKEQPLSGNKSDLLVYHWGNRSALEKEKFLFKKQRNVAALQKALESQPADPYYNFLMGFNLKEIGGFYQAVGYFEEANKWAADPVLKYEALIEIAWCFFALNLFNEALANAQRAREILPQRPEALIIKASILNVQKKYQEVVDCLSSLKVPRVAEADNYNIDLTYYYYLPNYILGEAQLMLGHLRASLESFKKAYKFSPEEALERKIEVIEKALAAGIEYFPAEVGSPVRIQEKVSL